MASLIDKAYEVAQKNFVKKEFTFNDLWKLVVKDENFNKKDAQELIGAFYTDLIQDTRFVYVGDQKWLIKSMMLHDEWAKLSETLHNQQEYLEEGYEHVKVQVEVDESSPEISNEGEESSLIDDNIIVDSTEEEN
ncbi:DNA-directed RNA polymerase subunit delta [Mycoplasmoides gallisepticum]|uniref:RNAP delta factor n=6 Tax=Mycoplasmoides gallisepticum TaxID=2096 RepID=D3KFY0_MYCGA|nr:DNA-directed RNA polymerase subunit delta [Mycoplasmoides gallisepticum]AAP57010.2 DNA-directed RNA polymerase subunit delta (RpoE) [Mycoplasmoides gallisepticum str. R(low)]ADC30879.1 DNA-directed RNA polymerase subunit delta (RpoE) [Mycoplasmoides gallisepticum str. R(high)]ADC31633.1 DNA-directed RNA polymerase subunit delta (RpoE) [Mycoplasmoides gallisepticum str. F]AFP76222.1 DNA-directed RNA polymerase subunit delta (RpoE) [Mycoplasmoides gallisepticum VA94_7994-1-7P]AFP76989.1 DNA-d